MHTHHALLLLGTGGDQIYRALALIGVAVESSSADPDIQIYDVDQFGVDEARLLKQLSSSRPVVREKRVFLVRTGSMTGEAQNALLKLLEDPPLTAQFIFILPREDALIPTLRSRFYKIDTPPEMSSRALAREFLSRAYDERLKEVASRAKAKDDAWAEQLLAELEEVYAKGDVPNRRSVLGDILFVRRHFGVRGSSTKMLLEHLAISLPPA